MAPIYQEIIDWALSQQQYETTHNDPAPLTTAQRKALLDLHLLIKPPPAISPEPELGSTDWVSLLHRESNPTLL